MVEYIESFYNNIHKLHTCVILERIVLKTTLPTQNIIKYKLLTTEGNALEAWEDDILPVPLTTGEKKNED